VLDLDCKQPASYRATMGAPHKPFTPVEGQKP
jgi:hypothetical protein